MQKGTLDVPFCIRCAGPREGRAAVRAECGVRERSGAPHRRVQARDHDLERRDLEQRPRLELRESIALDVAIAIEPMDQPDERLPLRPVRWPRSLALALASIEVRLAQLAVDVVIAGDDQEPIRIELQVPQQPFAELRRPLELGPHPPLRQVSGQRHQVRCEAVLAPQQIEVLAEPPQQRIEAPIGVREAMVPAELHVRDVQDRDRRLVAPEARRLGRPLVTHSWRSPDLPP